MTEALSVINKIFFICAIVSVVLAAANYAVRIYNGKIQAQNPKVKNVKRFFCFSPDELVLSPRVYYILLGIIALIGVAIRVWQFGSVPGGFNQDGACLLYTSRCV